jgi:phospholipid/cholesterol/gamma-HCH transport system substrate-binding protein
MRHGMRLAAGVASLSVLLAGCGFHGLYSTSLPGGANLGSHPYTVTVEFADVLDLVPQSSVNARAELLQTSLLGEKYVQLEQPQANPVGDLRAVHAPDGAPTIPIEHTGRNPEVEEVLGALSLLLSGGGLPQIRTITHELDTALSGRTGAVRDLLSQLNTFVGGLDKQKDKITAAIENVDVLAARLDKQKQVLVTALNTLPAALKVLDGERNQLVGLLDSLDRLGGVATNVINATSDTLVSALRQLDPVLTSLTKTGKDLPNAMELFLTYPFPRAIRGAVKGDYTNTNINLDLNLSNVLDNLLTPTAGTNAVTSHSTGRGLPSIPGIGG